MANDTGRLPALQATAANGAHILYPGSGAPTGSLQLAPGNYELAVVEFDGANFRLLQATPASAAAIGMTGGTCLARWSFPAASSYAAGAVDFGLVLSNYNSPPPTLPATFPPTPPTPPACSTGFPSV